MNLKKGQKVTIEGICRSGENMFGETIAQLQNCRVVNASQPTSQASVPSVKTENMATETSTASTQTQQSVNTGNTASQTFEIPVMEYNYKLTDAEYKQMMKNPEFAKADKALKMRGRTQSQDYRGLHRPVRPFIMRFAHLHSRGAKRIIKNQPRIFNFHTAEVEI